MTQSPEEQRATIIEELRKLQERLAWAPPASDDREGWDHHREACELLARVVSLLSKIDREKEDKG